MCYWYHQCFTLFILQPYVQTWVDPDSHRETVYFLIMDPKLP